MIGLRSQLIQLSFLLTPALLAAQTLDPAQLLKPLGSTDTWATYSGDYSGKRYSTLSQLNQSNVKNLTLAWSTKIVAGSQGRPPSPNLIIGGIGTAEAGAMANIKASILQINGILTAAHPPH